jgi:hypothetical protein
MLFTLSKLSVSFHLHNPSGILFLLLLPTPVQVPNVASALQSTLPTNTDMDSALIM